jgi:glycerophosphoryl diester phosphodiesterase
MPYSNQVKKYAILFLLLLLTSANINHSVVFADKVELHNLAKPHYRSYKDVQELQSFLQWRPNRQPIISAHRGGPIGRFPENAIETFENILQYAPCLIECDVRLSKDGHLVMMHDDALERTSTGKGEVSKHTLMELKKLFLKDRMGRITNFRIPTLAEALQWAKGRAVLQLDVKRNIPFEPIIAAIRRHRAESRTMIIVYNTADLQKVHRLAPELMISSVARGMKGVKRLFTAGVPLNRVCVFVGVTEPDSTIYDALHKKGIMAILGTIHNLDNRALTRGKQIYRQLYKNGADILASDNVPLVSEAIKVPIKLHQKGEKK